jgi:Calpain large subunit, domain III
MNHSSWRFNPQLFVSVGEEGDGPQDVVIRLTQGERLCKGTGFFHIGFYVNRTDGALRRQLVLHRDTLVGKAAFEDSESVELALQLDAGKRYVVVPCTFNPSEVCCHQSKAKQSKAAEQSKAKRGERVMGISCANICVNVFSSSSSF